MKIIAILGTYRKGGVIDTAVDEILGSAQEAGADVSKVFLIGERISNAFCRRGAFRAPFHKPDLKRIHGIKKDINSF